MSRKLRPLAAPDEHHLTPRELLFVGYVMEGKTLTQAGELVGITPAAASAWIDRPAIAAEMRRRQQALTKRMAVSEDMIVNELAKVGFASMGDIVKVSPFTGDPYIDWDAMTPEQKAAVAEVEIHYDPVKERRKKDDDGKRADRDEFRTAKRVKIKLHPKLGALDQLTKMLGLYKATQVDVKVDGNVSVKLEAAKVLDSMSDDALRELELAVQKAAKGAAEDVDEG